MIYGVYSIRDEFTGFLQPTVDMNDNSAIRNFRHAIMQKNTLLYSHAKDYDLYRVGEFDTDTGTITPTIPTIVIQGIDVKRGMAENGNE